MDRGYNTPSVRGGIYRGHVHRVDSVSTFGSTWRSILTFSDVGGRKVRNGRKLGNVDFRVHSLCYRYGSVRALRTCLLSHQRQLYKITINEPFQTKFYYLLTLYCRDVDKSVSPLSVVVYRSSVVWFLLIGPVNSFSDYGNYQVHILMKKTLFIECFNTKKVIIIIV